VLSPFHVPSDATPDALVDARIPRVLQDRVVGIILASFFAVHRELGHGFVESVYQRALALEFTNRALQFEQEAAMSVFYKGAKVGHHRAPFVVEGRVVVEIRAGGRPDPYDELQLNNCVKASGCDAGLLLHFGRAAIFRHVDRDALGLPAPRADGPADGASQVAATRSAAAAICAASGSTASSSTG
jgi:GxxExxY protein